MTFARQEKYQSGGFSRDDLMFKDALPLTHAQERNFKGELFIVAVQKC